MRRSLLPLAFLSCALPGCIFVADDDPEPVAVRSEFTGTLVVDWTINGTTDPDECDQGAATWLTGNDTLSIPIEFSASSFY